MTKNERCCKTLRWARASSNLAGYLVAAALLVAGAALPARSGENWPPILPEELALKDDPLNPGAHAMILYREMHTDDVEGFETYYYRIKIFTEKGKKYADIEIPYLEKQQQVEDIQARTVRSDGTAVDFGGRIFDKVVVKVKKLRFQAKTFTLPEVQRGSIIEYSYRLRRRKKAPGVLRHPDRYRIEGAHSIPTAHWTLNHELFTRRARFSLRPFLNTGVYWTRWLLPEDVAPRRQPDRTIELEVKNIPAFQEEQYTLPEDLLKSRVDIFYSFGFGASTKWFWRLQGKQRAEKEEKFIGKAKGVRRAVARVISPNDPPEIKLRKLYARAQQVRNLGYERPRTEKEKKREALKDNKSVEDVLKRGYGSPWDINRLLVALARAAGFDAAVVMLAAGDNRIFRKNLPDFGQLNTHVVQVRLGAKEVFLDPATPHCPFGFLSSDQAGVQGLRLEKDGGVFVKTPLLASADVVTERKATLQLDAAGTLQGTVAVVFRRQKALWWRLAAINEDEVGRREKLEEEMKGWLPEGATVELENVTGWEGSEEPLRAEFSVEIPNFTVKTGRRLLLPLGLFQVNEKHPFPHAKRVHPIYFGYPWQEKDEVTIQLPAGYQVESVPEARKSTPTFAGKQIGRYEINCEAQGRTLRLRRELERRHFLFPVSYYVALREFYSSVRAGDEDQIVLQAVAVGARQ